MGVIVWKMRNCRKGCDKFYVNLFNKNEEFCAKKNADGTNWDIETKESVLYSYLYDGDRATWKLLILTLWCPWSSLLFLFQLPFDLITFYFFLNFLISVSRLMGSSAGGSMGHAMSNMGSLAACSVTDTKPMQFPLAQRRKRRVLFTQAQVCWNFLILFV